MSKLKWDQTGERFYETGVDHGVLYIPDNLGVYGGGVSWNGLVSVSESPTGAEPTPMYADNIKYLNLISREDFMATIEAFTYPPEFDVFDGQAELAGGVTIGQQNRGTFGLSYRTKVGNDVAGQDHGYKLHLVYGCLAAPSERAYNTVNDSPEAITLSWELSTTPVEVPGVDAKGKPFRPTALVTIDSRKVESADLLALEAILYGTDGAPGVAARLPLPAELTTLFAA